MQKRLLIFHPTIAPYRIDYFNALNQAFEIKLVLWNKGNGNQNFSMEKLYAQLEFEPELKTERFGILGLKLRKGMLSAMRVYRPNTIMSCECGPVTIMAVLYKWFFNRKCRVVTMIDDSFDMISGGRQVKRMHALAERIVLPMLDDVICVDPRVTNWMQSKYGKGITMPIISREDSAIEKYQKLLPKSEILVEKFNLIGKKIVLYVGRLDPEKNLVVLVKSFLKSCSLDVVLVIVGSGKDENILKNLASDAVNIIFTGRLEGDDVYSWYNIAHIFVLPSLLEPFGAVTAEALYGGCYCLISNKAGSQCLIKECVNGEILNPNDVNDISLRLHTSLNRMEPISIPLTQRKPKVLDSFEDYMSNLSNHL